MTADGGTLQLTGDGPTFDVETASGEIARRVKNVPTRPLLEGAENLEERIESILNERKPAYDRIKNRMDKYNCVFNSIVDGEWKTF